MVKQLLLLIPWLLAVTGSDVIGTLGNSVTIDCDLPLSDSLVWDSTDGNVIAIKGRPVVGNSTKYAVERQSGVRESLVIHQLTLADDKVYRCYDLRQTDNKDLSTITVLVRPYHMNMTSPRGPVNEDSEVLFQCMADGGKPLPDIRWYRIGGLNSGISLSIDSTGGTTEMIGRINDVMYANGTGQRVNTLVFNVTRDHYNSTFFCNVTVSVFFQETFSTILDVQLLPRPPLITGFDGIYDANETVHVACTSTGSKPTANIMWLLDGMPIGDFEVVVSPEADGTSTVTSYFRRRLSREMNGSVLTCAVTNLVSLDLNLESIATHVTLLTSYGPNITVESNDALTPTSGNSVVFRFHVAARPAPHTLLLLHDGVKVEKSLYRIERQLDNNRYEVVIPRVSRSYAGNYSLSASNRLGTTVSSAIELKILYVPQCASSGIQKHAIHFNSSVHLSCRMFSSPGDVTMTWKYRHTKTLISITTASKDNSSTERVVGETDVDARSLLQYTDTYIECYGQNSVGVSSDPCVFQLVHPGPSEAPSNCTINSVDLAPSLTCQPGFDGGSTQAFSLQKLVATEYQTIANRSTSVFNLRAFAFLGNVTVRMCSVNEEFPNQYSCSPAFEVAIDGVTSEPTKAESVNTAAFLAGGLVAFIGLLCISAILIFILRKKQKNPIQSKQASKAFRIGASLVRPTLDCIRRKGERTNNLAATCVVKNHSYENTNENKENEVEEIKVISSTPCLTKQYRINKPSEDADEILKTIEFFRPWSGTVMENIASIDIRNARGIILSPILKHSEDKKEINGVKTFEIENEHRQSKEYSDKTDLLTHLRNQTLENKYSNADIAEILDEQTLTLSYSTADVADILDKEEPSDKLPAVEKTHLDIISLTPDPDLPINGVLTLNLDYSNADIASVLDKHNESLCLLENPPKAVLDSTVKVDHENSHNRTVLDQSDKTERSLFSECETNLGLSRSVSFSCNTSIRNMYMTTSFSSPDLSRHTNLRPDFSSVSCTSICNMFEERSTTHTWLGSIEDKSHVDSYLNDSFSECVVLSSACQGYKTMKCEGLKQNGLPINEERFRSSSVHGGLQTSADTNDDLKAYESDTDSDRNGAVLNVKNTKAQKLTACSVYQRSVDLSLLDEANAFSKSVYTDIFQSSNTMDYTGSAYF